MFSALPPNIFFIVFTKQTNNYFLFKNKISSEIKEFILNELDIQSVKAILDFYKIKLDRMQLENIYKITEGNPLYINSIVRHLKNNNSISTNDILPANIELYYKNILKKIDIQNNKILLDILGILLVTKSALNKNILLEILNIPQLQNNIDALINKLSDFIEYDNNGNFKLYHQKFAGYLKNSFFNKTDLILFNKKIIDYLEPYQTKNIIYGYHYLSHHYFNTGLFDDFINLIESDFFEKAIKISGYEPHINLLNEAADFAFNNNMPLEFCRIIRVNSELIYKSNEPDAFLTLKLFLEENYETITTIGNSFYNSPVILLFIEQLVERGEFDKAFELLEYYNSDASFMLIFLLKLPELFYKKNIKELIAICF